MSREARPQEWIGAAKHLESIPTCWERFAPPCAEATVPRPRIDVTADQRSSPNELQQTAIDYEMLYRGALAELERISEENVQTVVLIVDTQNLPDIPHWQYVSLIWQSRLRLADSEKWAISHLQPQNVGLGNVS